MNERDKIGTKLLFQNEKVNIWEMALQPGERSGLHEHRYDHVLVQISGDRMAVEPDPATKSIYNAYVEADVVPGRYFFIEKGGVETAYNVGEKPFFEIIIELKD